MIRSLICFLFLAVGAMGLSIGLASAQETPPPQPPQRTDSLDLVFEREVFLYPQYERRNPFTPLVTGGDSGPRIEEVQLIAVVFSSNPNLSVATFGTRGSLSGEGGGVRQTYRVKRGDRLGNIRIIEIQLRRVVVEVEEFGMTERRILELQRPGQGGLS